MLFCCCGEPARGHIAKNTIESTEGEDQEKKGSCERTQIRDENAENEGLVPALKDNRGKRKAGHDPRVNKHTPRAYSPQTHPTRYSQQDRAQDCSLVIILREGRDRSRWDGNMGAAIQQLQSSGRPEHLSLVANDRHVLSP